MPVRVKHFRRYLTDEEIHKVLRLHQRAIARFVHVQMQDHYWENAAAYEVVVKKGFMELKDCAYATTLTPPMNYRISPSDKSNMSKYLFGEFQKCLYPVQKFASDAERRLAVILEREAQKWFKPVKGQFQLFYKWEADHKEYQPDFVAETNEAIYILEPKDATKMKDAEVLAKQDVAVTYCQRATAHAWSYGGKPWRYALIPHDVITENMTLVGLVKLSGTT